jgi:hypothetical protein
MFPPVIKVAAQISAFALCSGINPLHVEKMPAQSDPRGQGLSLKAYIPFTAINGAVFTVPA